jgi:ribosomal protein S27AE
MKTIHLHNELGVPLYVAEYECPNCGAYLDRNGDWQNISNEGSLENREPKFAKIECPECGTISYENETDFELLQGVTVICNECDAQFELTAEEYIKYGFCKSPLKVHNHRLEKELEESHKRYLSTPKWKRILGKIEWYLRRLWWHFKIHKWCKKCGDQVLIWGDTCETCEFIEREVGKMKKQKRGDHHE